jgi:hypothetical protein
MMIASIVWWGLTLACFDRPHVVSAAAFPIAIIAFGEWAMGNPIISRRKNVK